MIVALSGGNEQGISGDIAVRPSQSGARPGICRGAGAEDIVESGVRGAHSVTAETDLPGFCDYYVIDQLQPLVSKHIDARPLFEAIIVGDSVIDDGAGRRC